MRLSPEEKQVGFDSLAELHWWTRWLCIKMAGLDLREIMLKVADGIEVLSKATIATSIAHCEQCDRKVSIADLEEVNGVKVCPACFAGQMESEIDQACRSQAIVVTPTDQIEDKFDLVCTWSACGDDDRTLYDTDCGNIFEFMNDGPIENRMKFCPYCGKRIEVV